MAKPKTLSLKKAAWDIHNACKDGGRPFFFMVGAGISSPPVPLASAIVEELKSQADQEALAQGPPESEPLKAYSWWFEQCFPQPQQRQEYLRSLIDKKPISQANFRLAHLLLNQPITNLVVTTNFDDFLSRALSLFGEQHVTCDHPATTARIDPEKKELQIVHVHGSYWFYDCCNLAGEVSDRSENQAHSTAS